ncbi:hypothetical protein D3C73_1661990 [compost metagenome]
MFNVISICFRARIAMSSESGMEIIEMIVDLMFLKKIIIISTANKAPNSALDNIVLTESVIGLP